MNLVQTFKSRTRSPLRPRSSDIIHRVFTDFRNYGAKGDSLLLGQSHFMGKTVFVVAQQKPKPEQFRSKEDVNKLNWGMLDADEHAQILAFLRMLNDKAPQEDAVLLSLIDTYGADISMYSARRLQAFFISHLIKAYLRVRVPTISVVLGEGGSGGAVCLQMADKRAVVEDAMYATAPPESLAAIIFRDTSRLEDALTVSKSTSKHIKHFGVVDTIIPQTKKVDDADGLAKSVKAYLERSMKELSRKKVDKLIAKRFEDAAEFGVISRGRFYDLKRFIERPLFDKRKAPPTIKLINESSGGVHVGDNYGDGTMMEPGKSFVRCGSETGKDTGGCGAMIPLKDYLDNHLICPKCGKRHVLDANGWVNALCDPGTFHELFRNLTVHDLLPEEDIHDYYRDFLKKQKGRSSFTESLVTAHAEICGFRAVLAISEFSFAGGSMGVVFGEKFRLASEYARRKKWPLVSVCCSGGARLYEGIVALMQMVKTVAAVEELKAAGIPFISILADPSTGGAIASYAALGDVCLAEPGAMVIFTGPRVMEARGFEVQEEMVRSDSLVDVAREALENPDYYADIRGIQEVVPRSRMRDAVARYLEFFARTRAGQPRKKGERRYYRRVRTPSLPLNMGLKK